MLSLLEYERFRPSCDDVEVTLVIDDEALERAFRVTVAFDAFDEQINRVDVSAWWRCDLIEHPLTDADAEIVDEIERFVDCCPTLRDEALWRQRDYVEDMAIYDRIAS